ncbi:MAG: peptidase [Gordonia sp.]|nr:peptidase [Gordonia sp. (in: high G+C Gram-positive bacteria)]
MVGDFLKKRLLAVVSGLIAVICMSGLAAGSANAAPRVTLGGGAGIIINNSSVCTLTAIGHDSAGRLVGLTAAHCAETGDAIRAEKAAGAGVIGQVTSSNKYWDYAVIRFDPAKVEPQRNYRGLTLGGFGPQPAFGQNACKAGRTTGTNCGVVWGTDPESPTFTLNQSCSNHGDSGAPVVVDNKLVGLLNGGRIFKNIGGTGLNFDIECNDPGNPVHVPTLSTGIGYIMKDLNGQNIVGSGFRLI